MKYLIGIDGGGSKTELLLCDSHGNIIKHLKGGSSNPISIGAPAAVENVENLIFKTMDGIDLDGLEFISVCIPGFRNCSSDIKILRDFLESKKALVSGDEESAFYGALACDFGIVILSGTGSFGAGINNYGERLSVGGWGPLIGDEGSGYFMGIMAIKAAIAEYEYYGPETVLTSMVLEHFTIDNISLLRKEVYKDGLNTNKIASLSKSILKGAELNDGVCLSIIAESARHLYNLGDIIIRRLNMTDDSYKLCLTGGISSFGDYILAPIRALMAENHKNIIISQPEFEPSVGSLIYAFKNAGKDIDSGLINNLKVSYKGVDTIVI